jgi:hypothetical protein
MLARFAMASAAAAGPAGKPWKARGIVPRNMVNIPALLAENLRLSLTMRLICLSKKWVSAFFAHEAKVARVLPPANPCGGGAGSRPGRAGLGSVSSRGKGLRTGFAIGRTGYAARKPVPLCNTPAAKVARVLPPANPCGGGAGSRPGRAGLGSVSGRGKGLRTGFAIGRTGYAARKPVPLCNTPAAKVARVLPPANPCGGGAGSRPGRAGLGSVSSRGKGLRTGFAIGRTGYAARKPVPLFQHSGGQSGTGFASG